MIMRVIVMLMIVCDCCGAHGENLVKGRDGLYLEEQRMKVLIKEQEEHRDLRRLYP